MVRRCGLLTMDSGLVQDSDDADVYGFDIEPCLVLGCSEEMLNNKVCDQACNNLKCDYDLGMCFSYFDYHGYGWDFEVL